MNDRIDIADIITEFFQATIHHILHIRKLYPESIFVPKKLYGIIVYQSEHPLLNEYISEAVKAVHFHAKSNQLHKLIVNIKSDRKVVEAYVFEVLQLISQNSSDSNLTRLKDSFRSFCLKLSTSTVYLNSLPGDAEFDIELHAAEQSALDFNEDHRFDGFPWAQINPRKHQNPPDVIPIHTVNTENIVTQIYIEKYAYSETDSNQSVEY